MEHAESPGHAFEVSRIQNALCPINQLPTEILCKIFVYTREAHDTEMTLRCGDADPLLLPCLWSCNDFKKQLKWVNVTHVCAHWRNVALDDPVLWASPSLAFPRWASCMLQRSQRAALTASVTTPHTSTETISSLLDHMSRLETLVMTQCEERTLPLLRQILDGLTLVPAPTLRKLHIHRFWDINALSDDVDVFIPKGALIDAEHLREVSLSFVDVDWDGYLLSSLESLALRDISDTRKPTAAQFRSMIERNPDLQELTLKGAFPSSQGLVGTMDSKLTPKRILLSHLKSITLESTLPQLTFFSSVVAFPPSISRISISLQHTNGYKLPSLLSDMLYQHPVSQIRSVAIEVKTKGGDLFVRFITSHTLASEESLSSMSADAGLDIEFSSKRVDSSVTLEIGDSDHECDSPDRIMAQLFESFHWFHLAELVCSHVPDYLMPSDMTWATTFGALPGLHTIIVNLDSANTLISAFQLGLDACGSAGSRPGFPGLRHFEIKDYSPEKAWMRVDVSRLSQCLRIRRIHGLGVPSIKVIGCNSSWVQEAEELQEHLATNIEHPQFDDLEAINPFNLESTMPTTDLHHIIVDLLKDTNLAVSIGRIWDKSLF